MRAPPLDGVCAAVLGVILPLVVTDVMRGTGRFNLGLGIVGCAVGIGAALSTTLAGYMMDHFSSGVAFWSLASVAARFGLAAAPRDPPGSDAVAEAVVNLSFRRKARTGRDAAMRPSRYPRT